MFHTTKCLRLHSRYALPLACLGALAWATAYTPAFSQTSTPTANGTDAAQERLQRQSDSVYRWIRLHSEPARKSDAPKPRARPDAGAVAARKPDARDAGSVPEPAPAVESGTAEPQGTTATAADAPASPSATVVASTPAAAAAVPSAAVETEEDLKPINQPQPEIPRELRASIANGRVILGFTVQPDGTVTQAEVVRTTNRRLSKPALDAVSQWRFEPIRVARTAQVEFEFTLQ